MPIIKYVRFQKTGSMENYFVSVGRQNNNNNPEFQGRHI